MLSVIARKSNPTSGTIDFADYVNISYFSSDISLPEQLKVFDFTLLLVSLNNMEEDSKYNEIVTLLKKFDLHNYASSQIADLSFFQKRSLAILGALINKPNLLILDEPTSALDVSVQAQILEFLKELQIKFSLSFLFISHDLSVIRHLCNRVAVMYLGEIVEEGLTTDIFHSPKHPYTQALLNAVPFPQAKQPHREAPLTGDIPSPVDLPTGCNFYTRCPKMMKGTCETTSPILSELSESQKVACHLHS